MSKAGLTLLLGCVLMMVALVVPGMQAQAADADQVCAGLDSGKIDVQGDETSVTVTAPPGYLIDAYCVKAGSVQGGTGGPVYVTVNPPQKTVTITYPGGKAISHYSYSLVPVTPPTTPPTTKTTTHTTPPPSKTTTHSTAPSHTTSAAAPASTATTYALQPVKAGATSDTSGTAPNKAGWLAAALLGLFALVTVGRRVHVSRKGTGSE